MEILLAVFALLVVVILIKIFRSTDAEVERELDQERESNAHKKTESWTMDTGDDIADGNSDETESR